MQRQTRHQPSTPMGDIRTSTATGRRPSRSVLARIAVPTDAAAIAGNLAEGLKGLCEWALHGWRPPALGRAEIAELHARSGHDDVRRPVALDGDNVVGHLAPSPSASEDTTPSPLSAVNLVRLLVRRARHGQHVANELMQATVSRVAQRGVSTLRLWTPLGAAPARRIYNREGWQLSGAVHEHLPSGLATVEHRGMARQRSPVAARQPQARDAFDELLRRDPASIVEHYFKVVGDLSSPVDALGAVLHPAVRITEHPNAISPRGAVRDRDGALAAFLAGERLLAAQRIDLHELFVSGSRVAVRATWRGTIGQETAGLPKGTELVAQTASLLTIDDGLVLEHETFDCYEPWRADREA